MKPYKENLTRLKEIKSYLYGDNNDVPVSKKASDYTFITIGFCHQRHLPQPEIFPWAGGDGIQCEWNIDDWYVEVDFSECKGFEMLVVKGEVTDMKHFEMKFENYNDVKTCLESVVKTINLTQ